MNQKQTLKKNFIWNMLGIGFYSLTSLFFLIIVTRINGVFDAGVFSYGFSMACLFYIIGVYSGRIFQVTDNYINDKEFLINKIITCLLMMIISIVFVLLNNYNFEKSIIILLLCLFKMNEAFSEGIYAILQKNNCLYKTGISFILKAIIGIIVFLLVNLMTKNLLVSVIFLVISNLLIMLFYDFKELNKFYDKTQDYDIKKSVNLLKVGFFPFAMSFLSLYLVNSSKYIIDLTLPENFQAIFGILIMPATVMSLLSQFIIHPYIVLIKEFICNDNIKELKKIVFKILKIIFGLGLIVTIIAYFVGIPVLELIYDVELKNYNMSLLYVMIGSIFSGLLFVLTNVMIALRYLKAGVISYFVMSIITTISCYYFVANYLILGACINYMIIMLVSFIIFLVLFLLYLKKLKKEKKGVKKK